MSKENARIIGVGPWSAGLGGFHEENPKKQPTEGDFGGGDERVTFYESNKNER